MDKEEDRIAALSYDQWLRYTKRLIHLAWSFSVYNNPAFAAAFMESAPVSVLQARQLHACIGEVLGRAAAHSQQAQLIAVFVAIWQFVSMIVLKTQLLSAHLKSVMQVTMRQGPWNTSSKAPTATVPLKAVLMKAKSISSVRGQEGLYINFGSV